MTSYQRKPIQVQSIQWPESVDPEDVAASAAFAENTAVIFTWVNSNGGRLLWRDTGDDFYPAVVTDAGDIPVADGDWIVRLPGYFNEETKAHGPSRFIVETATDFAEDYQHQQRAMRGGIDVMAQIKKVAQQAEVEEESMTPAERREAASVEMHKLNEVAGTKPTPGKIRDLRNGD